MSEDLSRLRQEYGDVGLSESDAGDEPYALFDRWMTTAVTSGMHEPNAMVLATVSGSGAASARMVLLKGFGPHGFVFYTNYGSVKAAELDRDPRCALLLPWHPLQRQVRIEGSAQRLDPAESARYFATRPRPSQLGAWASPQSQVVPDRAYLEERYAQVAARFPDETPVPLPDFWGGYRVVARMVEFWQGRPGRMHDRIRFTRDDEDAAGRATWRRERLAP